MSATAGTSTDAPAPADAWAPFRTRAFAVIWAATLVSNIGIWVRDVASGWLMTDLSPSPLMVALVQAALTLPIFLLAMPAGALADILDRRRLLVGISVFLCLVSVAMALAVTLDAMTAELLLGLTFLAGIGAALLQPAFQAIVPELVPREALRPAIALNSMGINVARAIGPALGGLVLVGAGVAAAYALDALSTLVVIAAFLWWRRETPAATLPAESFGAAMATGFRYVARAPDLHRVLLRAIAFFGFASAYWALLPLIAREVLDASATFYGIMLAAIGAGAVAGALVLPLLSRWLSPGGTLVAGGFATSLAMALLATAPDRAIALVALFAAGAAWIAVLTSLNVAAQASLPNWVRARGLAVYLMAFYGAMAAGSAIWGQVAQATAIETALLVAAAGGALAALAAGLVALPSGSGDLTPSGHWPEPAIAGEIAGERGPVLVAIEYRIAPSDRAAFLAAAERFARRRRRDGAFGWRMFEDAAEPARMTEVFYAANWLEHLRQHRRVTADDAIAQADLASFHIGPEPPRVTHLVAATARPFPDGALAPHT